MKSNNSEAETGAEGTGTVPDLLVPGGNARILRRIPVRELIEAYQVQCQVDVVAQFDGVEEVILAESQSTGFRFFYPPGIDGDGKFYADLQHFDWYYIPWKWEHERALKRLRQEWSVLEIGCGKGDFLSRLQSAGQKSVTGIEMNASAARYAREVHQLTIQEGSLESFRQQPGSGFDVVCAFQVLEHVAQPGEFIRQALALLNPGGLFIVGVPNYDAVIVRDEPNNILDFPPHHMGWWNACSLKGLSGIFPLDLISLEKETIPKERLTRYYYIRISKFRSRYGIFGRIADKLCYPVAVPVLSVFRRWIPGHTILAVYRKR